MARLLSFGPSPMDGPRLLLPNAVPIFLAKLRPHRLTEPQNQKRERRTKRILEQGCLSVAMSIVNRTSFYGVAIPSSTLTSTVRARPFSTIHYPPRHGLPAGIRAERKFFCFLAGNICFDLTFFVFPQFCVYFLNFLLFSFAYSFDLLLI